MKETGFIGRESFRLKFTDITETTIAAILVSKISNTSSITIEKIEFSLLDLFPHYKSLQNLSEILSGKKALLKNRFSEYMGDSINFLLKTDQNIRKKEVELISFYNQYINQCFYFLQYGDNYELLPSIEHYQVVETEKLHSYHISIIPVKFIEANKKNIYSHISLQETLFQKFQNIVGDIGPGISYRKQLEFAKEYFDKRQNNTGEKSFEFNLKEIKYRHLVSSIEENGERLTLPAAMTTDMSQRILLPFFMESIGLLDVNKLKISNSPLHIDNIELIYSVNRPSLKNNYSAESYGLSSSKRQSLNETQIEIYERYYQKLLGNGCFAGRPELEKHFIEIFYWLIKKVSICLEEPSFLKEKSIKWLEENRTKRYTKMEDDFLLPFLHERLKEEFGEIIHKKPEKFGGEVDILFSELPLELKVRKNATESLSDIINEKYAPASQAATYAAVSRVGFVIVLDLPQNTGSITNLDVCFHLIEKEFDSTKLNTNIMVCILHCNLPTPSAAK